MEIEEIDPPRKFRVGVAKQIEISHTANIELQPDEQVTFVTKSGTEFDVARKSWGYYGTPSTNGRLANHNLRAALISNEQNMLYVMLCEKGKEEDFQNYLDLESQTFLTWIDSDENVDRLKQAIEKEFRS